MSPRSRRRGQSGGGSSQRNRRKGGQRSQPRQTGAGFWGDVSRLPEPKAEVRISDDPAAVVRSLGTPPLPGHEIIAEAYFAAVYDRVVSLAGALATAAGLATADEAEADSAPSGSA